jgi:hypothetical protein
LCPVASVTPIPASKPSGKSAPPKTSKPKTPASSPKPNTLNNQSTLVLVEKLAEAIETNKPERANAIAIILASRLGYSDCRQLLKDVRSNISTAIPRR